MTWEINLDPAAEKELSKLDKPVAIRILKFLQNKLVTAKNPRMLGQLLKGPLSEYWKYRVGDYRLICSSEDHQSRFTLSALLIDSMSINRK